MPAQAFGSAHLPQEQKQEEAASEADWGSDQGTVSTDEGCLDDIDEQGAKVRKKNKKDKRAKEKELKELKKKTKKKK